MLEELDGKRKIQRLEVNLYEGDKQLLDEIQKFLGCSRSEAIRSSIRAFSMSISRLMK